MLGREYFKYPEILTASFSDISAKYKKISLKNNSLLTGILSKGYVKIFGIPEIGLQLRFLFFKKVITKYIAKKRFNRILDAGSGIGVYSFFLKEKWSRAKVYGYDMDPEKIRISQKMVADKCVRNMRFLCFNIGQLPLEKDKFDFIISVDVLEHIRRYRYVLSNFYNSLKEGGYLYIHTPRAGGKRFFKRFARKRWHKGHVYDGLDSKILEMELKRLGFKILHKEETFGFWGKFSWELHHLLLEQSLFLAGLFYPLLYIIALADLLPYKRNGIAVAFFAQK